MINSKDINRLEKGLELLESKEYRKHILNTFYKIKDNTPFSPRLNKFIENKFKEISHLIKFVDKDDFDDNDTERTFIHHLDRYATHNEIHVWTGSSDKTIFGDPVINHKFRAWHDYIHLTKRLGYDSINESIVAKIQINQLPDSYLFEKELINIEVIGQVQYMKKKGLFVENQRKFTIDYLRDPIKALGL